MAVRILSFVVSSTHDIFSLSCDLKRRKVQWQKHREPRQNQRFALKIHPFKGNGPIAVLLSSKKMEMTEFECPALLV